MSASHLQSNSVNFFTHSIKFQGAHTAHTYPSFFFIPLHPSPSLLFFLAILLSPPIPLSPPFFLCCFFLPLRLPVSELSLADAPDGSSILEHLSAVCLHHGSSAAIEATWK
ncbi:hypothetical protein ILYODFUR_007511 [Ilyodon furcidens]|uniref:Uncharacterized protein n=1 Tax=Ilyodon furcidens TaxID=33524 RepID=A0ABV0VCD0_9TELE